MNTRSLAIVTLAALLVGVPAYAAGSDPASSAPVRIVHCNVYHNAKTGPGWIHIGFTNSTQRALNFVRFKVDFAGTSRTVDDKGLFSPGVDIHHTYIALHPGTTKFTATCTPVSAQFNDGGSWP